MGIVMINGSPKMKNSTSGYLLSELKNMIGEDNEFYEFNISKNSNYEKELDAINLCDKLIFAFPIYVDTIPSHALSFLEEIERFVKSKNIVNVTVYTVVNCGFFEGKQTGLALEIMENWCKKQDLYSGKD